MMIDLPKKLAEFLLIHPKRIHLIGVAGSGMSGIAGLLLALGHRVSGCDRVSTLETRRLETLVSDPWDELVSSAVKITPKMRRDVGLKT